MTVGVFLVGLIAIPALAGVCLVVGMRRLSPAISHGASLAVTGVAAACALALLPYVGQAPALAIEWLPGMGAMGLELGATGLYAALVTVWAAFAVLFSATSRDTLCTPLSGAMLLFALAATVIALVARHFLLRYVALEVAALCIALAPLVAAHSQGARYSRVVYLILRVGDAGLLVAILILMAASSTLDIGTALQAGKSLPSPHLGWAAAGLLLAVWIKLGGWPLHFWLQVGQQLSLDAYAWLYATVMPNLGLYLLYRVTPLLAAAGPVRQMALWIGSSGAVLAAVTALLQAKPRMALIYVGAVQGGLAVLLGATGVKTAVWLGLLALTPLRLLLILAVDMPARSGLRAGLLTLGGVAMATWGVLSTYWAREAGAPLDVLFVAEVAVALLGIWAVRTGWRSFLSTREPKPSRARAHWTRWTTVGMLGAGILGAGIVSEPLLHYLVHAGHGALPTNPTPLSLLQYVAMAPATWIVAALAVAVYRLQWRPQSVLLPTSGQIYDLEQDLARIAQTLRTVIEVGIQEQIIATVVRAVVDGAALTQHVVEERILEGTTQSLTRAVTGGGRIAYRIVEQEGLEGLLRRTVQMVLALARMAQRWHTGKLRRNLLWVAAGLALAILAVLVGW